MIVFIRLQQSDENYWIGTKQRNSCEIFFKYSDDLEMEHPHDILLPQDVINNLTVTVNSWRHQQMPLRPANL